MLKEDVLAFTATVLRIQTVFAAFFMSMVVEKQELP